MGHQRYTDEFRIEAVRQVTEKGHPVREVARQTGGVRPQPVSVGQEIRSSRRDPDPPDGEQG